MKQNELFNKCCENVDPKTREEVWKQMKFTQIRRTGSDETALYAISDHKATIGEFVEEVLKQNPGEWGCIEVNGFKCEYR